MTYSTNLYLKEVLNNQRLYLLKYFKSIKEMGFYLAGGTALALQVGHRESIDFDYFINEELNTQKLFEKLLNIFNGENVIKTFEEKNTLYIEVNGVKISFFTYKYDKISKNIESKYFNLSSLEDISAMKLWAIQNRATNKDYVDLYFLVKELGLEKVVNSFYKKFGNIVSDLVIKKSLVFFDDIDNEELVYIGDSIDFEDVKKFLINEVVK